MPAAPLPAWYPLLHLGLYQVVWFVALMGGAAGLSWPGPVAGGAMLTFHLALMPARGAAALRLLLAAAIGVATDAALMAGGTVGFIGASGGLPPGWMIILWPCFAALFDDLLRWVPTRPLLAVVLGGLGGPAAYLGGQALGAVVFPGGTMSGLVATGIAWAFASALLVLVWRLPSPLRAGTAP